MSALSREESCCSDLALDRALSGELDDQAQRRLSEHLAACVRCSVRHETLLSQRAAQLLRAPSWQDFATQLERRKRGSPGRRQLRPRWVFAALAAVAVLAIGLPTVERSGERAGSAASSAGPGRDGTRSKGGPSLGFYVMREGRVRHGSAGDVVHPGELVRFTYSSDQALQFALLSRDRAHALVYHPVGDDTTLIASGHDVPLDFSIRLDDQLGPERVYGLFCRAPQHLPPIRAQLDKSGELPQLPGCQLVQVTWTKQVD